MNKGKIFILASGSETRRRLLINAGVALCVRKSDVDEEQVKNDLLKQRSSEAAIALELARAKAKSVAEKELNALVLGSDQILVCQGRIFSKAPNRAGARRQLLALRGKEHRLISAASLWENGREIWSGHQEARLCMRDFSEDFLDDYLDRVGDAVLSSVGCYELEKDGVQLFSGLSGDYFAILGLPLLPLLDFMRRHGILPD